MNPIEKLKREVISKYEQAYFRPPEAKISFLAAVEDTIDHLHAAGLLMVWLPIETAPRDGTSVLVHSDKWVEPTMMYFCSKEYFEEEYGDPNYMEEGWYISHGMVFDQPDEYTYEPTRWMPKPPEPEKG